MWEFFASGIVLGFAAGLAPGPLLALVIGETLSKGTAAGIRVAMAPLISDLPIVLATLLALKHYADLGSVLTVISLAGAVFLLFMSYGYWRASGELTESRRCIQRPLLQGVIANLLNPHPYLFWLTVGGSLLGQALAFGPLMPTIFLLAFYGCLVGSKIVLAVVLGRTRSFIDPKRMRLGFRVIGSLLFLLALDLLYRGLADTTI